MRKIFIKLLTIITLSFCLTFCACGKSLKPLNIYVVDGAPVLSVLNLQDRQINDRKVNVKVVSSADVLQASILNGNADMAIMPVNIIAAMNAKGQGVKLVSVNVFGCLYIIGKQNINSLNDLIDKKVSVVGQNGTPGVTLRYLLEKNNVPFSSQNESKKVFLNYVNNDEILPLLMQNKTDFALVGEPMVTKAMEKDSAIRPRFNLAEAWLLQTNGLVYTQAGLCAKSAFLNENADLVEKVYQYLNSNKDFVYQSVENLSGLIPSDSALKSVNFTTDVLDRCGLGCQSAHSIKNDVSAYLSVLQITHTNDLFYRLSERSING